MVIALELWVKIVWFVAFSRNLEVDRVVSLESGQDLTKGNGDRREFPFDKLVILLHWLLN